jgi:conjugative relaxase-like TrwC/TraI family protein
MLRINQSKQAAGAKSYYSTADYYSEGQELTGHWRGVAAGKLGLHGAIEQRAWDDLCDNLHPQTGQRLTRRTDADRTVGYDFNFHVPKSLSWLYAMTRDERLLDAVRYAVGGTMAAIEAEMATRVRKDGKNENRITGNMLWGEFIHFTSRPVDGIPDPHLHLHCFVFNNTWDKGEQAWKAGQFRDLKRDAPYFEAVFHSQLSERLAMLGLPIERSAKAWELGGVGKPTLDKFSRRTAQIEDKAREKGIDDAVAKSYLGAKTRENKRKDLSFPELQATWRSRLTEQELDVLATLENRIGEDAPPPDETSSARALGYAIGHVFERQSVVPERHVLAAALRHSVGKASVKQIHAEAGRSDLIVGERRGRRMATTRGVLKEEKRLIDFARQGRGRCKPFQSGPRTFQRNWLNEGQKKAVEHILGSRDQVILLRGAAGVGKTTLMQETVEAIEAGGTKVLAFAPSAAASRGVLRGEGFREAETVARLLADEPLQQQARGQVLWVDEAGLLGSRDMARLFDLAERLDARLLLTGDRYQHGSVARGSALRLLEEEAGLVPAEVKEIQRQSGDYKAAVRALSEGNAAEGLRRLDALGWVREAPHAQRYQQMARDYVAAVGKGETALAVSPTHSEAARITAEIRESLKRCGVLKAGERSVLQLENAHLTDAERGDAVNYQPGDVLQFHQNAKGFTRGQRVRVSDRESVPLQQAARFQVFHASTLKLAPGDMVRITHNGQTADGLHRLDNGSLHRIKRFDAAGNLVLENGWLVGKDFGHLAHGYVVTSHASQGRTVDRVFIGQAAESFPASSREQFYVSVSRARKGVAVYTDDKGALLNAISRADERLSATEFVNGHVHRDLVPIRQAQREYVPPPPLRGREEVTYER